MLGLLEGEGSEYARKQTSPSPCPPGLTLNLALDRTLGQNLTLTLILTNHHSLTLHLHPRCAGG
jgi:hypothetical protein